MGTGNSSPARSYGIFILLVAILGLVALGYFFPRNATISNEAVGDLVKAADQMEKVVKVVEKNTVITAAMNRTVIKQLSDRSGKDDAGYDAILKKYGIDLNDPNALPDDLGGMLEQPLDLGSEYLPPSKVGENQARLVQGSGSGVKGPADGSSTRSTDRPDRAPSQPAG